MSEDFDVLKQGKSVRVGPYLLHYELAHGNMGAVYMAYDEEKDQLVAVKFLNCALCKDEQTVARFGRETFPAGKGQA